VQVNQKNAQKINGDRHKNLEGGVSPNPQVLSTSYEKKYLEYNSKHLPFTNVRSIILFPKFGVGNGRKLNDFNNY